MIAGIRLLVLLLGFQWIYLKSENFEINTLFAWSIQAFHLVVSACEFVQGSRKIDPKFHAVSIMLSVASTILIITSAGITCLLWPFSVTLAALSGVGLSRMTFSDNIKIYEIGLLLLIGQNIYLSNFNLVWLLIPLHYASWVTDKHVIGNPPFPE
jgi:hypothetical protein